MSEVDQAEQYRKALEDFIVNNADLERLEALLDRFNIFEAVGLVRQEIRHSTFLAFLLDPNESHGIGDAFAKRLFQRAVVDSPSVSAPVTPIELSLWDLGEIELRREWRRIDVFLLDERNRLAVIIENKIGAGEHGDQLDRYYKAVREQYPDYRLLALYLTPGSDEPSHPEYLPVDYRTVCEILDDLAESRASVTEPDLRVLITHYTEMLRRHIVGDSEIATLSQQIYRKHKRAIDLIIQHQPSASNHIREVILGLVDSEPRLIVDREAGENVRFAVSDWDTAATLSGTTNWSSSKRILLFEVHNKPPDVRLILFIGPGRDKTRNRLFELAKHTGSPFQVPRAIGKEINRIYSRPLIESETLDEDKSEEEIRENWADFLENDLPRIDAALKQEHWIWDMSDTGESEETPSKSERFGWSDEDIETQRPDRDPDQSGY